MMVYVPIHHDQMYGRKIILSFTSVPLSVQWTESFPGYQVSDTKFFGSLNTLEQAVSVVSKTLNGEETVYDIIPWKLFSTNSEKRDRATCGL